MRGIAPLVLYNQGMSNPRAHLVRPDPLMPGGNRERSLCALRGFTLVELLVTISVISVLIGLLIPSVGRVRDAARNAACMSNQHQLSTAWMAYMSDHKGYFPFDRPNDDIAHHVFDWGGVHWYRGNEDLLRDTLGAERPINPYVGNDTQHESDNTCFLCPSDDGVYYGGVTSITVYTDDELLEVSTSDRKDETLYGIRGTSYYANEWNWIKPGSPSGFWHNSPPQYEGQEVGNGPANRTNNPMFTNRNGLDTVANPSKYAILGDAGSFIASRLLDGMPNGQGPTREGAIIGGLHTGEPFSWWHGYEECNHARLDGSVKHVKMIPLRGTTAEYDIWMDPTLHSEGDTVIGWRR